MAKDLITTYFTDQTVTSKIMYKIIDNIIITHWLIATFLLLISCVHLLPLQVRSNYQNGQYALAHAAARDAKRYNTYGIIIGAIALALIFISVIAVAVFRAVTSVNRQ